MPRKIETDLHERRLDEVRELKARHASPAKIADELSTRWKVGRRRVFHYTMIVDKELAQYGANLPPYERRIAEQQVIDGLANIVYEARLRADDPLVPHGARATYMRTALEGIEKLAKAHGLYRERLEVTGADGGPLQVKVEDARQRVRERVEKLAARLVPALVSVP